MRFLLICSMGLIGFTYVMTLVWYQFDLTFQYDRVTNKANTPMVSEHVSPSVSIPCLHRLTFAFSALAFVITPATQRTDITWDDEYTVIVGDWYHQENAWLVANEFLTWVSSSSVS